MTTAALANASTASHNPHVLFVVRAWETQSLSTPEAYNAVLVTVLTMTSVRSPGLAYLLGVGVHHGAAP